MAFALAFAVATLVCRSSRGMGALWALLIAFALLARLKPAVLFTGLPRLAPLILFAFIMPALFTRHGVIVAALGPVTVTREGLSAGGLFAARLALLSANAGLMAAVSSPEEVAAGLKDLLLPLRRVGLSPDRWTSVVVLSWQAVPAMWARCRLCLRRDALPRDRRRLLPALADWLASLYREAERADASRDGSARPDGPGSRGLAGSSA
jgi:energy-coupling factor transport system permease protein